MNEDNDAQEWEKALGDYSDSHGVEQPPKENEEEKPPKEDEEQPSEGDEKKPPEGDEDEDKPKEDDEGEYRFPTSESTRTYRASAREAAEQSSIMQKDIREQMFSDMSDTLLDSEGKEIKSIEDVKAYENPSTGEPFTDEEAAAWLLRAQQELSKTNAEKEKQITEIAEVNLTLLDEADAVKQKYGEVLKANPEVAKRLTEQFKRTLTIDEASGMITRAPVSLEDFYDMVLQPYAEKETASKEAEDATEKARKEAEEAKEQAKRARSRSDREDIYSNNDNAMDDDDKEWASAYDKLKG